MTFFATFAWCERREFFRAFDTRLRGTAINSPIKGAIVHDVNVDLQMESFGSALWAWVSERLFQDNHFFYIQQMEG